MQPSTVCVWQTGFGAVTGSSVQDYQIVAGKRCKVRSHLDKREQVDRTQCAMLGRPILKNDLEVFICDARGY